MPESRFVTAAFDIGGTTIDAALVSRGGRLVSAIKTVELPETTDTRTNAKAVLSGLVVSLGRTAEAAGQTVYLAGFGMPGPADYETGTLLDDHKDRLPGGVGYLAIIAPRLLNSGEKVPVFGANDADVFGIGAVTVFPNVRRLAGYTVGTGLGGVQMVGNRLATQDDHAPQDREVWNTPFKDGILEDYASAGAVTRFYESLGGDQGVSSLEIAQRARGGDDPAALRAYEELAVNLGQGVALLDKGGYHPTRVVFGGKVARSFDLFGPKAQTVYAEETGRSKVEFRQVPHENLPLVGAARYAQQRLKTAA